MRLGGDRLVDVHTFLVLRHVARVHEHLAVAHRQIQRHVRIVGVGLVALLENTGGRHIILVVESVAALYLVHLGDPAVGLGHLVHVSVELGQFGRLGEILQRFVVILGFQSSAAQVEIAVGKRLLGRGHQRSSLLAVHTLFDHLFELRGSAGIILGAVSGRSLIVDCSQILRRERHRRQQRDCQYE